MRVSLSYVLSTCNAIANISFLLSILFIYLMMHLFDDADRWYSAHPMVHNAFPFGVSAILSYVQPRCWEDTVF